MHIPLTAEQIKELRAFDTCLIDDAIESFGVRLRNEGFPTSGVQCLFKGLPPLVGYAATCRVRSADPPLVGSGYVERTDWWKHVEQIPPPRVVVMQDVDQPPGTGAFFGKVHAHVLMALGCVGVITNGGARELPAIEAAGFQIFAGRIAVSRAYVHIVEFGGPAEFDGLTVRPGDLIHGDRHGFLTVPQELALEVPAAARMIQKKKQSLMDLSRKPGTTHEELRHGLMELFEITHIPRGDGAKQWRK